MGRPAKFCKEKAIEIALETFWKKGYEATSVSELSAAMSITRSSFYNCFKTREALFDMVLERYQSRSPDYFLRSLDDNAAIIPAIRRAFKNLCAARAKDPEGKGCLIIKCLTEAANDEDAEPQLAAMMKSKVERYEGLINRAIRRGELPVETDVTLIARTLITQMIGLNIMSKLVRSEDELWTIADTFLNNAGLKAA